jgi:peptidoglycan/LPS O-acetylase OafA/YrhL
MSAISSGNPLEPSVSGFGHVTQLDGLRAFAVALVVVAHQTIGTLKLEDVVPGGFGVTIFFFLSGYLITSLLRVEFAKSKTVDIKAFYIRRTLRIFPPLYITILFCVILGALGLLQTQFDWMGVAAQALYVQNYTRYFLPGVGVPIPLWSLAVEEHFYLLFPLFFFLILAKLKPSTQALILLGLCGLVLISRTITFYTWDADLVTYLLTHNRADALLFGCILAVWQNPVLDRGAWRPKFWMAALAAFAVAATLVVRNDLFRESIRYSIQSGALFVIFSWVLHDRGLVYRILSHPLSQFIGKLSYTIYLAHQPMGEVSRALLPAMPFYVQIPVAIVLTLLYSYAMYRLIERPAARLRKVLGKPAKQVERQSEPATA